MLGEESEFGVGWLGRRPRASELGKDIPWGVRLRDVPRDIRPFLVPGPFLSSAEISLVSESGGLGIGFCRRLQLADSAVLRLLLGLKGEGNSLFEVFGEGNSESP